MNNSLSDFTCEIFPHPPQDFSPIVEVAGCFCECQNRFLLLKRHPFSSQGNTWGIPAGKLEKGETPQEAVLRETREETSIFLSADKLFPIGKLYVRQQNQDFIFYTFVQSFSDYPPLFLNEKEHVESKWVSVDEAFQMPLIAGGKEAIRHYQLYKRSLRGKTFINVYLLLYQQAKLLLALRQNTGYADGLWGLVAGNVEGGESAQNAMLREAQEEIGITISPSDLHLVHTLHRRSDRENIDLFFSCSSWGGTLQNCEEHKCTSLHFFDPSHLPANTIPYIADVLQKIEKGISFSQAGWDIHL
jgi:8-oxo-dGTP pyrophosphatase MutT (NUDIX family)